MELTENKPAQSFKSAPKENVTQSDQNQQKSSNVYDAVTEPKPLAIVIHCGDPRFQPAFSQFIENELGLAQGQYIPFIIGGGAGVLAHPENLPKDFKFMRDRLERYRGKFPSINRLVLINHEDCGHYKELGGRMLGILHTCHMDLPRTDMGLVAQVFTRLLSHLGLKVERYYAKFADPEHTQIVFEKLSA